MRIFLLACWIGSCLAAAGPVELDLLTFNIRHDNPKDGENAWPKRKAMVGEWLKAEAPDVVGLQEALRHQIDDLLEALPTYAEYGVGRDDGKRRGEHCTIFYKTDRFGIDETEHGTFWLSDTPEVVASKTWGNGVTRICTWARLVDKETMRGFYVYNTHWDHRSQPSRDGAAKQVAERIAARKHKAEPVVLMGDFNADEANPAVLALKGGELKFVDTFREVHPEEKKVGSFSAFRGAETGRKIDHVFVLPETAEVVSAEIVRYNREGRYLSDHYPVRARLKFR